MFTAHNLRQVANAFEYIKRVCPINDAQDACFEQSENILESFIDSLPSGSGFDAPPTILEASQTAIVLNVPFHTLSDGYYVGWVNYQVRVYPEFDGLNIDVTVGDNFENVFDRDLEELKDLARLNEDYVSDVYWALFED